MTCQRREQQPRRSTAADQRLAELHRVTLAQRNVHASRRKALAVDSGTPPRFTTNCYRHRRDRKGTRRPVKAVNRRMIADRARTANDDSGNCPPTISGREEHRVSTGSRPSSCGAMWHGASTRLRPTPLISHWPGDVGPAHADAVGESGLGVGSPHPAARVRRRSDRRVLR